MYTHEHFAPVWYFTPFYAILRAVPDKLLGVIAMGASIVVLFLLPWLDRCKVRSYRYRSKFHLFNIGNLNFRFFEFGILGARNAYKSYTLLAQIFSLCYFMFFVLLFFYSKNEATKPLPTRVTYK